VKSPPAEVEAVADERAIPTHHAPAESDTAQSTSIHLFPTNELERCVVWYVNDPEFGLIVVLYVDTPPSVGSVIA
jgi:hypothetical protein